MSSDIPTAVQLDRAAEILERRDLDAIVVWSRQSLRHLSGLYFPHLAFLPEEYMFLVCTRAGDQVVVASYALPPDYAAKSGIRTVYWDFNTDPWVTLAAELRGLGVDRGRIGVEVEQVTVSDMRRCEAALPEATWHEVDHDLMMARQIKTPAEIALIDETAKAGERAIAAAVERGWVGMTDREFSLELRIASLREGVDELTWLALNWNSIDQRDASDRRPHPRRQRLFHRDGLVHRRLLLRPAAHRRGRGRQRRDPVDLSAAHGHPEPDHRVHDAGDEGR